MCTSRAEYRFFDTIFVHLLSEKLSVEINIKGASKASDMGMGIYFTEAGKMFTESVFHVFLLPLHTSYRTNIASP